MKTVWLMSLLVLVSLIAPRTSAVEGDKVIFGQVFKSDHTNASGYPGTYVAIIVIHNGSRYTYEDPNGLDDEGWYSVNLPYDDRYDKWDVGDEFRVWVDGTPWDDGNWSCHNATGGGEGHSDSDRTFIISNSTVQQQDVETLTVEEVPEFGLIEAVIMIAFVSIAISAFCRRSACNR